MIPFKQVYRVKTGDGPWTIAMGLTPYPSGKGLWFMRASPSKPAADALGKIFEGEDGKIVVVGDNRFTFEPLTLERFDDMKDDVGGFEAVRPAMVSNDFLQDWYWDQFGHDGDGNEVDQTEVIARMREKEPRPS
jgi:hypothetical protein